MPSSEMDKPEVDESDDESVVDESSAELPAIASETPAASEGGSNATTALPPQSDFDLLPVVGLGGSAGSIKVLQEFFKNMPPDSGLAFVVILHLLPDHESHLAGLLETTTSMPVVQINEPVQLEPNRVYVIPPNKHLTMADGKIQATDPERPRGRHVAIDLFFRTLAATHRSHAVAVVLSGADGDGAIGIKRIKEHGGVTIAQDPDEAEHDSMPRAAIETGMVDWILPVADMPGKLLEFIQNEARLQLPSIEPPDQHRRSEAQAALEAEAALREVLAFLQARTGHNFAHYKRATVLRRVARRLQVNSLSDMPSYAQFLRTHPGEAGALLQDLLISVTNFFRDSDAFDALAQHIPLLFRGKKSSDCVRVWVPGCATGEEAYSLAMLLCEHASTLQSPPSIQLFATDMDEMATRTAREGLYPAAIAADVSPERLRRFFVHDQGRYRVRKDVRELILFASHDLLKDSPFSRLDLISCRNLLIYFNPDAQERVFEVFHFALRAGGLLFLGASESADETGALFTPLNKKQRIYTRREVTRPRLLLPFMQLPVLPRLPDDLPVIPPVPPTPIVASSHSPERERDTRAFNELHLQLLEHYAPPSVLVNEDYEIVHLSEHAGRYLQFAGGEVSVNLLTVVAPVLRLELRTALFRAVQTGEDVDVPAVEVGIAGENRIVSLRIRPLRSPKFLAEEKQRFLLVIFDEQPGAPVPVPSPASADIEPMARRLEAELRHLKDHLRNSVEQFEASNEELKASNEELQAMNEELRSTSEELETSKEELQAANEELITVNQEFKSRVEEVNRANSDLQNLMASTDIATIFLDRELRIKRYTPRATDLYSLLPSDLGRPLADLRHRLNDSTIIADATQVLEHLIPVEREVNTAVGRWFLLRVLPYRASEDKIDGVLLTFVDITRSREAETALRESEERYRRVVIGVEDYAIFTLDPEGLITSWNSGVQVVLGYSESEFLGLSGDVLFLPADRAAGAPEAELRIAAQQGRARDDRWMVRKGDVRFFANGVTTALYDKSGQLQGFSKIMRDMTERQQIEEELQLAHAELEDRIVERTGELARTNEDLRAEAAGRVRSEAHFSQVFNASPLPLIITTRSENRLVDVNEAGLRFFGAAREELIGRTIAEVSDWSSQELGTRDTERTCAAIVRLVRENGLVRNVEIKFQSIFGDMRNALLNAVQMEQTGEAYLLKMFLDITDRKRAEAAREMLLRRLVSTQEEERRRISRELHDQMGQTLTALMIGLKSLPDLPDPGLTPPSLNERIQFLETLTVQLTENTHRLAWELRPAALDNLGIEAALRQYIGEWSQGAGVRADFVSHGFGTVPRLPGPMETALYRVVQEALTNVTRHAGAAHVSVLLERMDNEVAAIIEDDGRGFEAGESALNRSDANGSQRLGLLGMQERMELVGGTLTIESAPAKGTTVYARVSLKRRPPPT